MNFIHVFEKLKHNIEKDKVEVKKAEELPSNIVQPPDDLEATYRKKDKKK